MQPDDAYAPRNADVASEDFDGEFVVLDLETGKYFSLSGGSALVWRGLIAGHTVGQLTAKLPEGDARRAGIAGLVDSLLAANLLVVAEREAPAEAGIPEAIEGNEGPYGIQSYDDLADLLAVDPVHDVDEAAGWPHLPPDKAS